jgi:hypothetical protein
MTSKEDIRKQIEALLEIDTWNNKQEKEFNDLSERYPEESQDDTDFLEWIGEASFLKLVNPQP